MFLEAGCASLPPAPQGSTCIVDTGAAGADCVPIPTAINRGAVLAKDATTFVPFAQMNNYIAFSPSTWGNIQQYIEELKVIAQRQCQ
jgi:hypothetical protein